MKIEDYGTYTIRSTVGKEGGYVHIPWSVRVPALTAIWGPADIAPTMGGCEFMFIEADDDPTYYIVNRRSGLCLRMVDAENNAPLWQAAYDPARDSAFRFAVEPVGEDIQLVNCFRGQVVMILSGKPVHAAALVGWDPRTAEAAIETWKHNRFELTQVATYPVAIEEPAPDPWSVRLAKRPARVKSLGVRCEGGDETPVAKDIVPFFMVNDPAYSITRQVDDSPYYQFVHSIRWTMIRDRVFDGRTKLTTTETSSFGMSHQVATSLEHTMKTVKQTSFEAGIDPEIEAKGVKAKGISAKFGVSKTASRETRVAIDTFTATHADRSTKEEVEYPALGYRYRIVTWRPMDVFELQRADGQLVDSWTSIRGDEEYVDFFPDKAPATTGTTKTPTRPKRKASTG